MVAHNRRNQPGMDADQISRFRDLALMELKRAERYRNFLSLLVLNLSEFLSTAGRRKIASREEAHQFMEKVINRVKGGARETDLISEVRNECLVMLLPETNGEGARVAGERLQKLLSEFLSDFLDSDYRFDVPLEITSFPEESGKKYFQNRLKKLFLTN
jgi:GGDEF domain-containing protein